MDTKINAMEEKNQLLAKIDGRLNIGTILSQKKIEIDPHLEEISTDLKKIRTMKISLHPDYRDYALHEKALFATDSQEQQRRSQVLAGIEAKYQQELADEAGLVKAYDKMLNAAAEDIAPDKAEIDNDFNQSKAALESHTTPLGRPETEQFYQEQKRANAELHDQTVKILAAELGELKAERQTKYNELSNLSYTLWKVTVPHRPSAMRKIIYAIGLAAVALAEMPVNYPVFQLFGEGKTATYVMALMFGIVIMMLAHVSAASIKKSEPKKPYWLVAPVICLLMVGVSFIAGYFRSLYISEVGTANISPTMMAVLNFFIFIAGFGWSLIMTSKIPTEKRKAYEDLYKIVTNLNAKIRSKENELDGVNQTYLDTIAQDNATKLHKLNQEIKALDYTSEAKKFEEKRNDYEEAERIFKKSENYLKIYLDFMMKRFRADLVYQRQILMEYFPVEELGPEPSLDIPELFKPYLGAEENRTDKKIDAGLPVKSLILSILLASSLFLSRCGTPDQPKYDIAIMVDQTEQNQKLQSLVDPNGILELMKGGYGRISFYEINAFSLNKTRKISLKPRLRDETAVLRKRELTRFTTELAEQWKMFFTSSQGEEKTSIYLPIAEAAKTMNADPEAIKIIIIVSDMIENSDISFYRLDLNNQRQQEKIKEAFLKKAPLPKLSGYQIYIIYAPRNIEDDATFRAASNFWKTWLETMGAQVTIKGNL